MQPKTTQLKTPNNRVFARYAIAIVAFAQLFGTSLWFSANSAALDLIREWSITAADIGWLTNAVQAGFILGTFLIAATGLADRFKASSIFVCAAILGAVFNFCFAWLATGLSEAMLYRFFVGMSLAGIYPIGMKLVIQWAPDQAGQALARLVAMLTLGTALPFALNGLFTALAWQAVMSCSSVLALIAAGLIYRLGDAKHSYAAKLQAQSLRAHQAVLTKSGAFQVFKIAKFRAAAVGYFGHMWELYAFWAMLPLFIQHSGIPEKLGIPNVALLSFAVIAAGAIGCLLGGYVAKQRGSAQAALGALWISGLSCLAFVVGWRFLPAWGLLIILLVWAIAVIADSPQFSALSAQACPPEKLGAALAIQNAIGFAITIVSITLTSYAFDFIGLDAAWILLIGPVLGLVGFYSIRRNEMRV